MPKKYPNWTEQKCDCCSAGMLYTSLTSPIECSSCDGTGRIFIHKSGIIATYPGGKFLGKLSKKEKMGNA